jgi:hypothetical protein
MDWCWRSWIIASYVVVSSWLSWIIVLHISSKSHGLLHFILLFLAIYGKLCFVILFRDRQYSPIPTSSKWMCLQGGFFGNTFCGMPLFFLLLLPPLYKHRHFSYWAATIRSDVMATCMGSVLLGISFFRAWTSELTSKHLGKFLFPNFKRLLSM